MKKPKVDLGEVFLRCDAMNVDVSRILINVDMFDGFDEVVVLTSKGETYRAICDKNSVMSQFKLIQEKKG